MDRSFVRENSTERARLRNLIASITDGQLLLRLPNGWPIYVALAHLAFWDQRSTVLMKKWSKESVSPSSIEIDVINDTLLPFFLAIPPRRAADLALSSAEAIDSELEQAPGELIAGIAALGERFRLFRSDHRKLHLDKIDSVLEASSK
jgi:hypothetical protein